MLYEILARESATFEAVNRRLPEIGKRAKLGPLLPSSGRLWKSHELFQPKRGRVINLVRDVRDVAISEHSFLMASNLFDGTFDEFLVPFMNGKVNAFGSWLAHTTYWLAARRASPERIYLVKYEDLRHNPDSTLAGILDFLAITIDSEIIGTAIQNNTINRMREKEASARQTTAVFDGMRKDLRFVNCGATGGWRQKMNSGHAQRLSGYAEETLQMLDYPLDDTP